MKWMGRRESTNVESGGGMGRMLPAGGIGTLVLGLVIYFLGGDPSVVLNTQPGRQPSSVPAGGTSAGQDSPERKFVAVVLADTEDVWGEIFRRMGRRYQEPKIVLFSGQVKSACGVAGTSTGPFYCPADQKLYLDFAFFRELKTRHGAPGDFAQAYVIAHEVGHHVQNLLGTLGKVNALQQRVGKAEANQLSVRLELQADYYAGVWAHYAQKRDLLDPGDVEEALAAASAVGDDRLQQQARGYVVPDSFTHGTSE
ncbi:MAG TPA: neutral zinc metallopeptidase, partial [Abditibacteriaceae bacterium]